MSKVLRGGFVLSVCAALLSCGLLKKKAADGEPADAAPDVAVAQVVDAEALPALAPQATNENDVARFPDEIPVEVPSVLQRPANAREAPPSGKVVAALPAKASVTQVALRDKYILVVFDDPKTPGQKLMGWIVQDALSAPVPGEVVPKTVTCAAGQTALVSDLAFCGVVCTKDADCKGGQACKGTAQKLLAGGKRGDTVRVCTAVHLPDAGPPPRLPDASVAPPALPEGGPLVLPGLLKFIDAGRSGLGLLLRDAGAAPAPTTPPAPPVTPPVAPPGAQEVAPTGGSCPAGFFLVPKSGKCHKIVGSCPGGCAKFCVECVGQKVCSSDRNLCR